jgi:hypothetical protein
MKKFMLIFVTLFILFYVGAYFVFDLALTTGSPPTVMLVRVEQGGSPFTGALYAYDKFGEQIGYSGERSFACFFYNLSSNWDEFARFEIRDPSERTVFSLTPDRLAQGGNVRINLDSGSIVGEVSFAHYLTGIIASLGWYWPLFILIADLAIILGVLFGLFVITIPLSFPAMIYSIVCEKAAGIKRGFAGSYLTLVFGYGMIALLLWGNDTRWGELGWLFEKMEESPIPMPLYWFVIFVGYGLYFMAYRTFDAGERRAQRKAGNVEDVDNAINTSYIEYTWADGSKTDNRTAMQDLKFSMILWKVFFNILFLPLTTFRGMYVFYLLPILKGRPSWKLYAAWLAEQEAGEQDDDVTAYAAMPEPPPPPMATSRQTPPPPPIPQTKPENTEKKCATCGTSISEKGRFCPSCGTPVIE